jgi:hypothetical protein
MSSYNHYHCETFSFVLSPQGFGPARNIVAFTGGDVMCCPEFYGEWGVIALPYPKLFKKTAS